MKRVLIVAYYFPPAGGIGSLRLTGFAQHLPEFGWEPVVLAPRDPSYHRDPELSFPEDRIIRTGSLELSRAGKRVLRAGGDDTSPAEVGGVRRRLQGAARQLLYYPDAQIGWYPPAVLAGWRAITREPVDAIFSSSFPVTAHLVARTLQRVAKVPWLAEFRDPWSQTLPVGRRRRRAVALERALLRQATTALTVSPSWAKLFERDWGVPVSVLANGHDDADGPGATDNSPSGAEIVVGYLGTYYPETQDLGAAWAALAQFDAPFRIRAIGAPNRAFEAQLASHGIYDRLEVTGFLSQRAALAELASCSILILAGPKDTRGLLRGHVVAKVWEYLATDRPIVYVGDGESDVANILRGQEGCAVHGIDDVAGIGSSLMAFRGRRYVRDLEGTSRKARSKQLAQLLDDSTA